MEQYDPSQMRVSDEDRHKVSEVLREAAAQGRIDLEEALRKADSRDGLALRIRLSEGAGAEHDPYAEVFGGSSLG